MADPLFVSSESLQNALRLSAIGQSNVEALELLDQSISYARSRLILELTDSERTSLLATTVPTEGPSTRAEVLRQQAELCEVAMARYHAVKVLRVSFFDSSSDDLDQVLQELGHDNFSLYHNWAEYLQFLEEEIQGYLRVIRDEPFGTPSLRIVGASNDC